ncbi:MAG: rnpA [Bacteroidetes bacterium]|jgi:ribonuclease P protein component|nr:rnpA [Bacteroidota bacterium]
MNEEPVGFPNNSFPKAMRITRKSQLDLLFSSGKSFIAYPLRVIFIEREKMPGQELSVLISVSKRKFKRAVKRNRIKRLIRENFRLQRHELESTMQYLPFSLDVAFLFLKSELSDYSEISKAMAKALDLLKVKIQDNCDL